MARRTLAYVEAQLAAAHNNLAIAATEIIELKQQLGELKSALAAKELPQYVPVQVPAPAPAQAAPTVDLWARDTAFRRAAGKVWTASHHGERNNGLKDVFDWLLKNPAMLAEAESKAERIRRGELR